MDGLIKTENTEVLAFAGYQEFEAAADRTAVKIKEGYMEMGYILKMARDTDILRESEYSGYEEFAEKRYGLDKGTVSRYIRIVERFFHKIPQAFSEHLTGRCPECAQEDNQSCFRSFSEVQNQL